jgi:hypothetical protein
MVRCTVHGGHGGGKTGDQRAALTGARRQRWARTSGTLPLYRRVRGRGDDRSVLAHGHDTKHHGAWLVTRLCSKEVPGGRLCRLGEACPDAPCPRERWHGAAIAANGWVRRGRACSGRLHAGACKRRAWTQKASSDHGSGGLSYLIFVSKSSIHHMCAPGSFIRHIQA